MRGKVTTGRSDLAKLPAALKPLVALNQWAVHREEKREDGSISRPPRQARNPDYFANINDPGTWSDHATAVKAVKDGKANGLTFMLTKDDPLAVLDLDDCRNPTSGSIDSWAQDRLDQFNGTYAEASPSNGGLHVWGETNNGASKENRAFHLTIGGKSVAVEAYYHSKAITVTGRQIGKAKKLVNVDKPLQQTIAWGERTKAKAVTQKKGGNGKSSKLSIGDIDRIVSEGPINGGNRSEQFHTAVGSFAGSGWDEEQICERFEKHPGGIASKYIDEGRLEKEVARSFRKFKKQAEVRTGGRKTAKKSRTSASVKVQKAPLEPALTPQTPDPALPQLPQFFAPGQGGSRTHREWLLKGLMLKRGFGLLSGQWGSFKTFAALDLAVAICTQETFLDFRIKRKCGVMWCAYEGASEVEQRINAILADKCEGIKPENLAFRWYGEGMKPEHDTDDLPILTDADGLEKLIAMAKDVDTDLQLRCDRPLGLIIVDTLMSSAGYGEGGESTSGAAQEVMTILKKLAYACDVFVLAIDHYGKDENAGTRGSSAKEASADLVLACLGKKPDGTVPQPIFNVRKCRASRQGQRYPFTHREVAAAELDDDNEPVTTLVLDWGSLQTLNGGSGVRMPVDPWEKARQQSTRTYALRLKHELMAALTDHGVMRPVEGSEEVRMVALDIVRDRFYAATPVTGTPDQKRKDRYQQFKSALNFAQKEQLIGVGEFEEATHLWLITEHDDSSEEESEPANGQG